MMTDEHEAHLASILKEAREVMEQNYRRGNARHGEKIYEFSPEQLMEKAIVNHADALIFLLEAHRKIRSN